MIFGPYNSNTSSEGPYRLVLSRTSYKLSFIRYADKTDTTTNYTVVTTPAFNLNQQYTGAIFFDGTTLKIYIDGVSQTLTTSTVGTYTKMFNLSRPFYLFNYGNTLATESQFLGTFDEFALWKNRVFSEAELQMLFARTIKLL